MWSLARIGARYVDPYLDQLYGAIQMIESGTTTVQAIHSPGRGYRPVDLQVADKVVKAYQDSGMRVSYAPSIADQNSMVAGARGGEGRGHHPHQGRRLGLIAWLCDRILSTRKFDDNPCPVLNAVSRALESTVDTGAEPPTPTIRRPLLRWSSVVISLASITGLRVDRISTEVPSLAV